MSIIDKVFDDCLGDPFGTYEAEAGAKSASEAQMRSADEAIAEQRRQYDVNRATLDPYVKTGYGAIGYTPQQQGSQFAPNPPQTLSMADAFGKMKDVMDKQGTYIDQDGVSRVVPYGRNTFTDGQGVTRLDVSDTDPMAWAKASGIERPTTQPFEQGSQPSLQDWSIQGNEAVGVLQDYVTGGAPAFKMQQDIAGVNGPEAQQAAIAQIQNNPMMEQLVKQGEEAMLQNASATGGLRGGNIQGALAQYRPSMLNQLIQQQYSRLGGIAGVAGNVGQYLSGQGQAATSNLASIGQASAAGQVAAGQSSAANISNLLGERGAAEAGGYLAQGSGRGGISDAALKLGGAYLGTL